jgi:hypothetical protein
MVHQPTVPDARAVELLAETPGFVALASAEGIALGGQR